VGRPSDGEKTLSQARDVVSLGDVPLIVLADALGLGSGCPPTPSSGSVSRPRQFAVRAIRRGLQKNHLARSAISRLVVAEDSTHSIHHNQPEVVIEAIQTHGRGDRTRTWNHCRWKPEFYKAKYQQIEQAASRLGHIWARREAREPVAPAIRAVPQFLSHDEQRSQRMPCIA